MNLDSFEIKRDRCFKFLRYHVIHGKGGPNRKRSRVNVPRWMGNKTIKMPEDLILYQQVLYHYRPDVLVEVGTKFGGSALFFAHMFDLLDHGKVITIDINDFPKKPKHPRITYLIGESISEDILSTIRKEVGEGTCMVVLDGCHEPEYLTKELMLYQKFVTPNQYLVVEDVSVANLIDSVVNDFLQEYHKFKRTKIADQFLMHLTRKGWLLRKKQS